MSGVTATLAADTTNGGIKATVSGTAAPTHTVARFSTVEVG
jgi:hypothetical protein